MVVLTEVLPPFSCASSATHDHNHRYVYDVFLSFRGVDTRNRFTDHLYNALLDAGIVTFLDDEEIETGEPLKPELERAIKSSRASVIVLSKNYASSTWCLQELVLILKQKRNCKQIVIPIFYDVEPTDVRKQQSSFGEAMVKHKLKIEAETDAEKRSQLAQKMELWKKALTQVADLKGKDAKDRKETDLIKEVVTDINCRLHVPLSNSLPHLVGRERYIKTISSWVTDGSCHTADTLTVVGMGGIGKTSLVRYVFGLHSSKFDKSSFVEGINTRCEERYNGLLDLQKQLHGGISNKFPIQVNDVIEYTSKVEKALARKRVFIVLDDIGSPNQLDALLGNKSLCPGSKIIITTKDVSLTQRSALFNLQIQPKHMMVLLNGLDVFESLKLLCIHAFQSQKPKEGYEDVAKDLVKYCEGHPLALKVLGRSLHKQDVAYWEESIRVLKKEPHSHITKALKMSFDSLPFENDKELFKHIACFFVGMESDVTETILNACDINTRSGITNLTNKCLLKKGWDNKLMMHQLVQDMGRNLVRQESPKKPWKRGRLWCHEESFKVLKHKKGKENLLGPALDIRMLEKKNLCGSFELETESFSQMNNLMLLQLSYVQLNGCFKNLPVELRWLCMRGSPLKSIPLDLPLENLVALDMSYSKIVSFDMSYSNPQPPTKRKKRFIGSSSKDKRLLGSLKILDLGFCEQLHIVIGFSELPRLERLILKKCISLIEVSESVKQCVELVHIDLRYCYKLKRLPLSIGKLQKVETLLLDGCSFCESQMEAIPSDLKLIAFSLPSSLRTLSLANSNLCNESFPMDLSCLSMLEELYLDKNPIVSMPDCVRTLPMLKRLFMNFCDKVTSVEHPPPKLRVLSIDSYKRSLRKVKLNPKMSPLKIYRSSTLLPTSPLEIDGMIKIQDIACVEEKVLHNLGWTNFDFFKGRNLNIYNSFGEPSREPSEVTQTQMYYEFGIFRTMYEGDEIPSWISYRNEGPLISVTIPSSRKKLKGLNFWCTVGRTEYSYRFHELPLIKISNITKNLTWIYSHYINTTVRLCKKCRLSWLSHWMFRPSEIKAGDHITISVAHYSLVFDQVTKQCGIGLVYEDGSMEEKEEEDALGYYKSWNHIIGGDLSAFQVTTGEYILDYHQFTRKSVDIDFGYSPFIKDEANYKEEEVSFLAFSQNKSDIVDKLDFNTQTLL